MDEQTRKQSPIFTKTSDLILWLLDHTEKFPKSERFRLARRLEDSAFGFYELLVEAVYSQQKARILHQADLELEKVRLYIRMANVRRLTTPGQYRYVSGMLVEIGKLLGGWIKAI